MSTSIRARADEGQWLRSGPTAARDCADEADHDTLWPEQPGPEPMDLIVAGASAERRSAFLGALARGRLLDVDRA